MPTIYRSSDASAPTISGTAGDLVTALDAILVNGYPGKAAAGWSTSFTAASKRSYKVGSPSAGVPPTQYLLDVDDTAAQEANMHGYETMTGVGAGSNPFPLAATGLFCRKSNAASGATKTWIVIADETSLLIAIQTGDVASTYYLFYFGEIYSYVAGDQYKFFIAGRSTGAGQNIGGLNSVTGVGALASMTNNFSARSYAGLSVGGGAGKTIYVPPTSTVNIIGQVSGIPYPHPTDGGLLLSPVVVYDGVTAGLHGELRGIFCPGHNLSNFNDGDTFSGSGAYAGRSFMVVKLTDYNNASSVTTAMIIVETTSWPRST